MALISNGTTIASGGSLSVSASPPSSVNVVGSYGNIINAEINTTFNPGDTTAMNGSSDWRFASNKSFNVNTYPAGTWRCMGASESKATAANANDRSTLWIRIS